jgi:release factor glutamine methyltransferase
MSLAPLLVSTLIDEAKNKIAAQAELTFSDPALEARLLFEHVSGKSRSWQMAHAKEPVQAEWLKDYYYVLEQRLSGKPIAFITGTQGFWSLELAVENCTLIPRQDTETLVEACLGLAVQAQAQVLDLGTGTGAIALALASERPAWQVLGVDVIPEAVTLAQKNAAAHDLNVSFKQSDWFSALQGQRFDMIVSNPPYVESSSEYLQQGDLRYEPLSALASGQDGLDDIRRIIQHAPAHLKANGWLLLEHGSNQSHLIAELFAQKGFVQIQHKKDYNHLERVTFASWPRAEK